MKRAKKKVGRPPTPAHERLSKTRSFRVRGKMDARLKAAAARSGRSVSEEIEHRLGMSFAEEDWHEQAYEEMQNQPPDDFEDPWEEERKAMREELQQELRKELREVLRDELRSVLQAAPKTPNDGETP